MVPDGDLFEAIGDGRVSVVTDQIKTFTETGLELSSGARLQADLIVTATGLNLLALGWMQLIVDGGGVELPDALVYKGMMLAVAALSELRPRHPHAQVRLARGWRGGLSRNESTAAAKQPVVA